MQLDFNIKGWGAIVIALILVGIIGFRLISFDDLKDDEDLMREIELQLTTEYLPDDAERLKEAYESGNEGELSAVADSITSTEVDVKSVKASSPIFSLSSSGEVVVKVEYALNDDMGERREDTVYYLFEKRSHSIGSDWRYMYDSSAVSYYLNFI